MNHPTEHELSAYRERTLATEVLLSVAAHLGECEDCRSKLRSAMRSGAALAELRQTLEDHVSSEQLQEFVDGELGDERRAGVEQHLKWCTDCHSDAQALQEFAKAQRPRVVAFPARGWWLAMAAAVLLAAAGLGVWLRRPAEIASLNDAGVKISLDSQGRLTGLNGLSAEQTKAVHGVFAGAALQPRANLGELQPQRSTLMGSAAAPNFHLVDPVGTAVRSERPEFHWTLRGSDATYIVTLKNLISSQIISSPELHSLTWTPTEPLQRGAIYAWQVAASLNGQEEVAPAPPSPQARLLILDASTAARLDSLPPSHLLRATMYAEAGLLDDAELEAKALADENPGSPVASGLLHRIQILRHTTP